MVQKQKIVVIVGPTSSGKTALSIELARKFGGEVVSADSRQVYRGLDIGTGKVTRSEMKGVRHHLLDITSPRRIFTAADFRKHASKACSDILQNGKLPIVCGGTGFYIDALLGRVQLPDVRPNTKLRARLEKKSATQLFAMLQKRDPKRAKTIDSHNKHRLIRALEIAYVKVSPLRYAKVSPLYDALWIGLEWPREELNVRIRERLKDRLKSGMIAEARRLHARGLSYKRMETLGLEYRYLARFLQGKVDRAQMENELAREIIRYAKRQMTYWRRNADIVWLQKATTTQAAQLVKKWLTTPRSPRPRR